MTLLPEELKEDFPYNFTYYDSEKKTNVTTSVNEKANEGVDSTQNPTDTAKIVTEQHSSAGFDDTGNPTTGPSTAKIIEGTPDAVYTTQKPNEVVNSSEKPTVELGTTEKPKKKRRKREEQKADTPYASTEIPGSADSTDNKKNDGDYDIGKGDDGKGKDGKGDDYSYGLEDYGYLFVYFIRK
jgi:hypothetical protein